MFKSVSSLIHTLAFALTATAVSLPGIAQDQTTNPMADMSKQMAEFGGQMQAAAKACGGYTAEQLAEMKQQQRNHLGERGMSAAAFDKAFDDGERKVADRWKTMSEAEQKAACEEIKQQVSATSMQQ